MVIRIKEHITKVVTPRKRRTGIFCTASISDAINIFSDRVNGDHEVVKFLKHLKGFGAELVELRTSPDKEELIATIKFSTKGELDAFYAANS